MSPAPRSLFHALAPAGVDFETLRKRHRPFLALGRRLLGIESNVFPLMEIWPTSFRTYNLLVPNFINVPLPLLGVAPRLALVGTAMYASSRAAGCMYCSAHCCAIAMRGGADTEVLGSVMDHEQLTPAERALVRVATGMSTMPASLTTDDVVAFRGHYRPGVADWLTHCIAMMGFLNKMMDTLEVDLEGALAREIDGVARSSGWTPGRHTVVDDERAPFASPGSAWRILLAMAPHMPGAIRQDGRWTRGVPTSGDAAGTVLRDLCGYDFPMVGAIRQGRIVRALTTLLRDNLQSDDSVLGLPLKHRAGLLFAVGIGSEELERGSRTMLDATELEATAALGERPVDLTDDTAIDDAFGAFDDRTAAALLLAKAMSTSPSSMDPPVVERVSRTLEPAETIELVTWLSLLSLLHRLQVFQTADAAGDR